MAAFIYPEQSMPRRRKAEALELEDRHTRCPWSGLRANDQLVAKHPRHVVAQQRRRCRQWLDGELTWQEVLGER